VLVFVRLSLRLPVGPSREPGLGSESCTAVALAPLAMCGLKIAVFAVLNSLAVLGVRPRVGLNETRWLSDVNDDYFKFKLL
jgi:hypothetical protein